MFRWLSSKALATVSDVWASSHAKKIECRLFCDHVHVLTVPGQLGGMEVQGKQSFVMVFGECL